MVQHQCSTPAHPLQSGPCRCVTLRDKGDIADMINLEILRWGDGDMGTWVGLIESYEYLQEKQEGQGQETTEAEVREDAQTDNCLSLLALKEEGLRVKNTGNL